MLCSKCHKNEATVYYKQNINGQVQEYALCSECAGKSELSFAPLNLFGTMFVSPEGRREQKRCTLCNSTLNQIKQRGKAGCAECYTVFSEELAPMINSIHSQRKHLGRAPKGYAQKRKAENELDMLRSQLKEAIEREEYEKAAELRDMIKAKEDESND